MTRSLWSLQNCSSSPIEVSLMYSILFIAVILLILIIILQTWAAKTCKKKMPQNALKLIILFISLCHEEAMCSIINKLWIKPWFLTKASHVPVLCNLLISYSLGTSLLTTCPTSSTGLITPELVSQWTMATVENDGSSLKISSTLLTQTLLFSGKASSS